VVGRSVAVAVADGLGDGEAVGVGSAKKTSIAPGTLQAEADKVAHSNAPKSNQGRAAED